MDGESPPRRTRALVWLSRWRIDVVWAAPLLLPFVHPTGRSIAAALPLVVAGMLLRLWARGHLDRDHHLTTTGPYALLRHPLYVGSFMMGLGFVLMTRSPALTLVFTAVFPVMYVPKAVREEAFLARKYGAEHARWAARVGALVPRALSPAAAGGFEWARVRRHREWRTWLGVAAALAALSLRALVPVVGPMARAVPWVHADRSGPR